jgi:hypothetical protein
MGGMGSGRPCLNTLASDVRRLDLRSLQSAGALTPYARARWEWSSGEKIVATASTECTDQLLMLTYRTGAGTCWTSRTLSLPLTWSACNFGGRRAWFRCPAPNCGRRVVILYGDDKFVCRKCRRISYESQRITPSERALARAQTLRVRFGASVDLSSPLAPKPKGMHSWTYTRRCIRIFAAERKAAEEVLRVLPESATKPKRKPENS